MVSRRTRAPLLGVALALLLLPAPAASLAPGAGAPLPEAVPALPGAPVALPPLPSRGPQERAQDAYAAMTGERLDREDVDVFMDMEFRDLDFDALGVVFGGGSFTADARLTTRLEFHVLSVGRVQEAVEGAAGTPVDLSDLGVDGRGQYLTADAFRATLAGEALAAFQQEQEDRVVRLITESFPEVTVLSSASTWSNTSAAVNARGDEPPTPARPAGRTDARNPPVTLVSVVELQYHKRQSLVGLVEDALRAQPGETGEGAAAERLAAESQGAPHERSAFALFGLPQVIHVNAPPGWDVALRLRLPEGFSFEEASPDVTVDGSMREARAVALARESDSQVAGTVSVTLSSRALVAAAMLGIVLVAGAIVRVPTLLVANRLLYRRRAAPGEPSRAAPAAGAPREAAKVGVPVREGPSGDRAA